MSSEMFLEGMRKLAGAVNVVTTLGPNGERRGLTATAVCSLSASPPSIVVCVNRKTWVAQYVADKGVSAVNVLSNVDENLARVFAGQTELSAEERFSVGNWGTGMTGVPIVRDALASFECMLQKTVDHATHTILVGEVINTQVGNGHSLLYLDGSFVSVAPTAR